MLALALLINVVMGTSAERPIIAGCVMKLNTTGTEIGIVKFEQWPSATLVYLKVQSDSLEAGLHGFHVHESAVPDQQPWNCYDTDSHYNPFDVDHGSQVQDLKNRHVGDLGNVVAEDDGSIYAGLGDLHVQLDGDYSILGRGVVLHSDEDDLGLGGDSGSLSTGNAGDRVACCTIQLWN